MKTLITTLLITFASPLALHAEDKPTVVPDSKEEDKITFTIGGKINKSGIYEAPKWSTVFEAIAISGGMKDTAYQHGVSIFRVQSDGTTKLIRVSLRDCYSGKLQFPVIQDKDRIYIRPATF